MTFSFREYRQGYGAGLTDDEVRAEARQRLLEISGRWHQPACFEMMRNGDVETPEGLCIDYEPAPVVDVDRQAKYEAHIAWARRIVRTSTDAALREYALDVLWYLGDEREPEPVHEEVPPEVPLTAGLLNLLNQARDTGTVQTFYIPCDPVFIDLRWDRNRNCFEARQRGGRWCTLAVDAGQGGYRHA